MMTVVKRGLFVIALASLFAPVPALADPANDVVSCASFYEEGQVAMRRARLLSAQRALTSCLDEACPRTMRADCARWLEEVESRIARVVVRCVGPDKRPLTEVKVEVDGELLLERLDGRAVPIDPGEHELRFVAPGHLAKRMRVLVLEGDKAQAIHVELASEAQPTPSPSPSLALSSSVSSSQHGVSENARVTAAFVTVGVLAGLGFGGFALAGRSAKEDLDACRPDCSDSQADVARNRYLVADVLLGVSIASFAGLALFLLDTKLRTR
jgi:hypothetical protein